MIPAALVAAVLAVNGITFQRSRAVATGEPVTPTTHCLWWKNGTTIKYSPQQDGDPVTSGTSEIDAIDRSFASWQSVFQGCASLRFERGPLIADRTIGFDEKASASNTNSIIFRTKACRVVVGNSASCWNQGTCQNEYDCWEYSDGVIGLTTTTFDRYGVIYDSDIELNSARFYFTTVDSPKCIRNPALPNNGFNQNCVGTDVQNTMTHEIGHLLGLDHTNARFCRTPGVSADACLPSEIINSTMNNSAGDGETYKREVDPGSREFICSAYPDAGVSRDCVVEPVFSARRALDGGTVGEYDCCALGTSGGGCSTAEGLVPVSAALALLGLRARRRGRGLLR